MTENFGYSNDGHILLKLGEGVIITCYEGEKFQKVQYDTPTIMHKEYCKKCEYFNIFV